MTDDPISELVGLLSRLPGIGERTATRLTYYILASDPNYAARLGQSLGVLHDRIKPCGICGNFSADIRCRICMDPRRDDKTVCVVARVQDLGAIERSGSYRGRYHVLHALLAPLDGVGPEQLPLDALRDRIEHEHVREVIVATPLSVEGEATALYVAEVLRGTGARVSRIASGIPHGGELEYADHVTVGRAFDGRRDL